MFLFVVTTRKIENLKAIRPSAFVFVFVFVFVFFFAKEIYGGGDFFYPCVNALEQWPYIFIGGHVWRRVIVPSDLA